MGMSGLFGGFGNLATLTLWGEGGHHLHSGRPHKFGAARLAMPTTKDGRGVTPLGATPGSARCG
jgi:hypothetical protein